MATKTTAKAKANGVQQPGRYGTVEKSQRLRVEIYASEFNGNNYLHVREHFLVTRNLLDYLSLFHKLRGATPETGNAKPGAQ